MGGNLDEVIGGIGIRGSEKGNDGFVDEVGTIVTRVENIEDVGEPSPRVLEGLMQADELGCDGGGLGSTETNDADAAAAGRRGDGRNSVGRDGVR